MRSQIVSELHCETFYFSSDEMWHQEKEWLQHATLDFHAFEMFIVLVGSVSRYYWDCPGRLIPSMVGFTVNPDQWCWHDRGQAWPGSSTPYWHLPHHLPCGGARSESINGLSWPNSGSSPFPSTPRTLRFTRPGRRRSSRKPLGPDGGSVSHWGKSLASFYCYLLLTCAKSMVFFVDSCSISILSGFNTVQFQRRWCMVWRLSLI